MNRISIRTKEDLIGAVNTWGFLPFFANEIRGFSIEENVDRRCWFGSEPGVWEWKGPVISEGKCVYGKFFEKKAGFISEKWFSDFANYRRNGYDFDARFNDGLSSYSEQFLYDIIASHHSLLSREIKTIGNYGKDGRKGFDTLITKLQMQGYVITSNFEYDIGRDGKPYGWGVARYAVPEVYLGKKFTDKVYKRTPEESFARMKKHLQKLFPDADEKDIERILG